MQCEEKAGTVMNVVIKKNWNLMGNNCEKAGVFKNNRSSLMWSLCAIPKVKLNDNIKLLFESISKWKV